jgi:hypothetical protein
VAGARVGAAVGRAAADRDRRAPDGGTARCHVQVGVQRQVRHARPPAGGQQFRAGRLVALAQRGGQIPGVQVPFGAGGAHHAANGHHGVAEPVVRQIPDAQRTVGVGARGGRERGDVVGTCRVRERRKLGGVLPGQLAGQAFRAAAVGHQPGHPADRRVVEVLVVIVRDAAQMPGQVGGAPFGAGGRGGPRLVGELGGQFTDDGHAGVVRGERWARCPIDHGLPPTVLPGHAPRGRASQRARVGVAPPPRRRHGFATRQPVIP